jgi:hypothetical protein
MYRERYRLLYGVDENPFEWDIDDVFTNRLITQGNGVGIVDELNTLNNRIESQKLLLRNQDLENEKLHKEIKQLKLDLKVAKDYLEGGHSKKTMEILKKISR